MFEVGNETGPIRWGGVEKAIEKEYRKLFENRWAQNLGKEP